jgi:mutator protein MutT
MKHMTLLFLLREDKKEVLLAMKKRGFGEGKWNGVGGKIEEGETPEQAVIREAQEEIGVGIEEKDLVHRGHIFFSFAGPDEVKLRVRIYTTTVWEGTPAESEEMSPKWFPFSTVPYDDMWVDDPHWLPELLSGKNVNGEFHFTEDGSKILSHHVDIK